MERSLALVLLALLGPASAAQGAPPQRQEDEAAVRAHIAALDEAFATANARGIAELYAADADILRPNQAPVAGRVAIEGFYRHMFDGPMTDVRKAGTVDRVRFVTPSVGTHAMRGRRRPAPSWLGV